MGGSDALAGAATELTLATHTTCLNINIQTPLCIPKDRQTKNTKSNPTASEGFSSLHAGIAPLSQSQSSKPQLLQSAPTSTTAPRETEVRSGLCHKHKHNNSGAVPQHCQKLVKHIHFLAHSLAGKPHQHIELPKIGYWKCTGKAFRLN